ncbi:MAG TPA: excalibur calcium-binding domain-containing protein [Vicinamibacterales bacterium]|jgi:hypothetical protein|nr:excalibur calcium-binding domain-containing protein [Vicinamibacterales bacterium]
MKRWGRLVALGAVATLALAPGTSTAALDSTATPTATATASIKYPNCKTLNKRYPHGVGRVGARDHVRGDTEPVTTFRRSNRLYEQNKHLDRDKDKVACEKR